MISLTLYRLHHVLHQFPKGLGFQVPVLVNVLVVADRPAPQ